MIKRLLRQRNFGLGLKGRIDSSPLVNAVARSLNPGRMRLESRPLDAFLTPESRQITFRITPHRNWDTGYDDLVALCALSIAAKPTKILEVGTCRGRATLQLAINNPNATIVTYDIDPNAGEYFLTDPVAQRIDLRIADFANDHNRLCLESGFDLIFIDGCHEEEFVKRDSALALKIISSTGLIAWHDYSNTGAIFGYNAVPEVLGRLSPNYPIFGVSGTNLAVFSVQGRTI